MGNCIFLIVGCSGSGKTTITEQLEQKYGLKAIQSYTTRQPRYDGETGHIFVSDEEFNELTDMVGYTEFAGNRYCATAEQVENNDLYIIDPKGIDFFMKLYKGSKTPKVIFISSDMTTRYERMKSRAEENGSEYMDAVKSSLERITNDVVDFYDYIHGQTQIDYTFKNNADDKLEDVVDRIYKYICSCESEVM